MLAFDVPAVVVVAAADAAVVLLHPFSHSSPSCWRCEVVAVVVVTVAVAVAFVVEVDVFFTADVLCCFGRT